MTVVNFADKFIEQKSKEYDIPFEQVKQDYDALLKDGYLNQLDYVLSLRKSINSLFGGDMGDMLHNLQIDFYMEDPDE